MAYPNRTLDTSGDRILNRPTAAELFSNSANSIPYGTNLLSSAVAQQVTNGDFLPQTEADRIDEANRKIQWVKGSRFIPTETSPQIGDTSPQIFPQGETQQTDPLDSFNGLLLDFLKRAQGVDTTELLKRRRALQRAAIGRSSEITQEELRTLSPSQQESIRQGNVSALRPDIDEVSYQIAKAEQATQNFETVYQQAIQFGDQFAKTIVAPPEVVNSYVNLIEANPKNFSTILSGVNDRTRQEVIKNLDYSKFTQSLDETSGAPSSVKEYEYAKSQGYTGSYTDFVGKGTAGEDFSFAKQYIAQNSFLGQDQLKADLLELTDLGVSEINSLVGAAALASPAGFLTDDQLREVAVAAVKKFGFGSSAVAKAKEEIQKGIIQVDEEPKQLTPEQVRKAIQYIDEVYGEGRSIFSGLPKLEF